jgi:hypothetical protein
MSFLETVRKSDGQRRFYVGGCRVTRQVFNSVGDGRRDCFQTIETPTHWRHYHCRGL